MLQIAVAVLVVLSVEVDHVTALFVSDKLFEDVQQKYLLKYLLSQKIFACSVVSSAAAAPVSRSPVIIRQAQSSVSKKRDTSGTKAIHNCDRCPLLERPQPDVTKFDTARRLLESAY